MVNFSRRGEHRIVAVFIAIYVVLATGFSLGPIFEGPDEIEHYRYIRTLVEDRALPDPFGQPRGEYHQAPLYYLLNVPLAVALPDDDFELIDGRVNPFYGANIHLTGNDNKNLYLHRRAEAFPYDESQTALAVHLLRLIPVVLGAATVAASYAVFRQLWPDRPDRRLLATGLVASWPQVVYLSSVISNDSLLNLLATMTLWALLLQLRDGPTRRGAVVLGLVLGALLLTKVSAVFVGVPVAVAVIPNRRAWRLVPLILAIILVVSGWWYVRNAIEYDDATGTRAVLETWKDEVIRPGELALDIGLKRVRYGYESVWARFGQGAVPAGFAIEGLFDLLVILTAAGIALKLGRATWALRRSPVDWDALHQGIVVVAFACIWAAALLYWASTAWSGNQGRYLLPGIAGWAALAAWGLDAFTPRRLRLLFALGTAGLVIVTATVSLVAYFLPAYAVAPVPDRIDRPLSLTFDGSAELIGMSPAQPRAHPGDRIQITLCWRALAPTEREQQVYLHSVEDNTVRRDSLPATGNLLSTDWEAGQTWAEHYVVTIPPETAPQRVLTLIAGMYDPEAATPVPAAVPDGAATTPVIGRLAINGPKAPLEPAYRFGNLFALAEPSLTVRGDQVELCLRWQATRTTPVDYAMFLHWRDASGETITQWDRQPRDGQYPTGAWASGEVIEDCMTLDIADLPPDGHLALGLYNLADFVRLPIVDSDGQPLPDDMILLDLRSDPS